MIRLTSSAAAAAFAAMLLPAVAATPQPAPKLSKAQAAAIAQKAVPAGTIVGSELETEKGGSGRRYSFDVKVGKVKREVGVDAQTGTVLENRVEGPNPD